MKKLIFISGSPISQVEGSKLFIDYYQQNGLCVEYWNLTRLYYDEMALTSYFGGNKEYRFKFPIERKFYNRAEVANAIRKLSPNNVMFCHSDFGDLNDYWLRKLFKKYNIRYYAGPFRTPEDYAWRQKRKLRKILFVRKLVSAINAPKKLFSYVQRKFYNYIYRYTNFYKKPEFVLGSGTLGRIAMMDLTQAKRFLSVPSPDLDWQKLPCLINDPYCVYVDDSVIYSPDRSMFKGKQSLCSDLVEYSKNICKVFEMVEKSLCCQVIIAASGKYRYTDNEIFGGRKIIYSKTNQLIQHAKFVVGHASSGTWQAIVNSKPVVLLWDPSFIKIKNFSVVLQGAYLGVTPIMSTELTPAYLCNQLQVNQSHYDELIEQYFCEKNVDGEAYELIKNEVNQQCHQ